MELSFKGFVHIQREGLRSSNAKREEGLERENLVGESQRKSKSVLVAIKTFETQREREKE